MARFMGRDWTRLELLEHIGDPAQIAGAVPCVLSGGKAEGVKAVELYTGGGLRLTVLPGRGMDIPRASFEEIPLTFQSGTGITSPSYYEEPGLGWLRSFFVGLLTTCGITASGAPSTDGVRSFGLHGRISNSAAEDVSVRQEWEGDEYRMLVSGRVREAAAMGENLVLRRTIETRMGWRGFRLWDVIENRGFEPQPLMMLYHFNFGYPLLAPGARIIAPIVRTEPRDEQAAAGDGVRGALSMSEPVPGYREKVFFHQLRAAGGGPSFVALVNRDIGGGRPLGAVLRFDTSQLPRLTEWKMMRRGFYVVGLEPGTVEPHGRGPLRERGELPMIQGHAEHPVAVSFEVVTTTEDIAELEREAKELK